MTNEQRWIRRLKKAENLRAHVASLIWFEKVLGVLKL